MRVLIESFEAEYRRYKALGEGAMAQVTDEELCAAGSDTDNSIAAIVWHLCPEAYNRSAPLEHAAAHAAMLRDRLKQQT